MTSSSHISNAKPVLIAGGGIGGLSLALTLHQIGVPCLVLEAVADIQPLGVGISVQPNAVREFEDLGIGQDQLDRIGIRTQEWALVGLNGLDVYSEPRGLGAGSKWPQYSAHRGKLQMLLLEKVKERLGEDVILTGHRVTSYTNAEDGVTATVDRRNGTTAKISGSLLIACDGLHSACRAQMYPEQPPIHWGGAVMWRGVTKGKPIRTHASFVGLGTDKHRVTFYPITEADPETGLADINWIAEVTMDNSEGWTSGDWNKKVELSEFIHYFEGWDYDWVDIQGMLTGADEVFEYPMIDRDPVPTWVDGNVALLGDAAHVMYPTGSNGASQAIVDSRVLGAKFLEHGVNATALKAYDEELCESVSAVVLRNRGQGPFVLLAELDKRCGGLFDDIETVFPSAERDEMMARYKGAAGYAIEALNNAPSTIPPNSRISSKIRDFKID